MTHKAAFRNGPLGNSVISPKWMIGKHSEKMMNDFAREHLVSGEMSLIGVNVDHELLLSYAQSGVSAPHGSSHTVPASKYLGGELRKDTVGPFTHVLIAGQAAGINDPKGMAAASVFNSLLGVGPSVKWSTGRGKAVMAVANSVGEAPFGVSGVQIAHSDQGLVGVYCISEAPKMSQIVKTVYGTIKDVAINGPSADELKRAKKSAVTNLLIRAESSASLVEDLATQSLATGSVNTPSELANNIESVGQADIQQIAKRMISKPTFAALGNLKSTPYMDEIV